jgi:carbamoyltransferase
MNILGLTHPMAWNNAACLVTGGELSCMIEEERLNRFKQSHGVAPNKAVEHCLETAGLRLEDIHFVAIGWDADDYRKRKEKLIWDYQFRQLPVDLDDKRIRYLRHHLTHALSAFYPSPFEKASVISLDGRGEQESGILGRGDGDDFEIVHPVPVRESWGYVYGKVTEALGFTAHRDEGKVMGLAAYGEPDEKSFGFIDWDEPVPHISKRRFRRFFGSLTPRAENGEITDAHRNLAATLQAAYQKALIQMARFLREKTGIPDFCLAGGCALNCTANGALFRSGEARRLFVQPAAHDAGTALGAALQVYRDVVGIKPEVKFLHSFHGPGYTDAEIEAALRASRMNNFRRLDDPAEEASALLEDGKVLGWFQGRMEVGPRALGGRSILADPRDKTIADRVNRLKGREPWRPLAPSVLAEDAPRYFRKWCDSPFMLVAFDATDEARNEIPGVVHVDGTVRAQTVTEETQPLFHRLISAFRKRTGTGALLNTSFNVGREPIICTPRDALMTFYASGLDALVMGSWLVEK